MIEPSHSSGGAPAHRRTPFRLARRSVLFVVAWLALATGWLQARDGRPGAYVPSAPDTVVERLPRGYAALVPTPGQATTGPAAAIAEAGRLLATASSSGDSRLAARAEVLLSRLGDADDPDLLRLRAFGAQHRHDFGAAVALLDRSVALDPRDGDSRYARAQVELVRGNLDRTRADCGALAFGVDSGRGLLCVAALSLRRGDFDAAARVGDRWLAQSGDAHPMRRHALVQRGEIASRAGDAGADAWFEQALALDRGDVRTLTAFARHLRATGRHDAVLRLLADAPDNDGIALQRALALHDAGGPGAATALAQQLRRYALARALGSEPELRDEAELLLARGHASAALVLAQRNFATQRDHEDVALLLRAAAAAGRPEALQPARDWSRAQGLTLPEAARLP